jgi:hypothetical protein
VEVRYEPVAIPNDLPCNSRLDCPDPVKGGVGIYNVNGGVNTWCTSGFAAGKRVNPTANHWYLLTAGHCVWKKVLGTNWNIGDGSMSCCGLPMGDSINYRWCDFCSADVGVIDIVVWDTPTDKVFANNNTDVRLINDRRSNAQQAVGAPACRGGFISNNFNCGQVNLADMSHTVDNLQGGTYVQTHQWRLNITSTEGDSGGPIMYGTAAMGLHNSTTSSSPIYSWYTTIDYAIAAMGYGPCLSAFVNPCTT